MSSNAYRWISLAATALAASFLSLSACTVGENELASTELTGAPEDNLGQHQDALTGSLSVGSMLMTTAAVNLRTGPSTAYPVLRVIPLGSSVVVMAANPRNGFYNIQHNGTAGWASGDYLKAGPPSSPQRDAALARAKSGVGFSYWWGHGRLLSAGPSVSNAGSCTGSCPNCSHTGSYGADCSGLAAKAWQVPSTNTDLTVDSHPYSTANFVSDAAQWTTIARGDVLPADAMVYHQSGVGHIFLYQAGDGWGSMYAYECAGCSLGCVYNLRTASSAYHAIRRTGY